jgi:glutamate-1-semialdehyde 2,1-aminomutase
MDAVSQLESELVQEFRRRTPQSDAWYQRARRVMPGGDTRTGTFHLPYPLFAERAQGCRLWDVDGNEYFDFLNNFTSLVHGHAHPDVAQAIDAQALGGTVHGTAHPLQVRLAEMIAERVPSVEQIRFCNSGTEATLHALRAARAFTGKTKIMKMEGGYHGSHDWVSIATAPPYEVKATSGLSPGALAEVLLGCYNDADYTADLIRKHRDELAAVIVEPMLGAGGAIVVAREFLQTLRDVTAECGVLLIVDEIITFRLALGGLQEHFGVRPDLTTFGKIIGGGLPIGAFGGRADVMATYDPTRPGSVSHSGTYNGNAVTMAAGIRTLELFDRAAIAGLNRKGEAHRARLNAVLGRHGVAGQVVGFGSLMQVHFAPPPLTSARDAQRADGRLLRLLHLGMLIGGIFAAARQIYVLSTPMTDDVLDRMAQQFERVVERIVNTCNAVEVAPRRS